MLTISLQSCVGRHTAKTQPCQIPDTERIEGSRSYWATGVGLLHKASGDRWGLCLHMPCSSQSCITLFLFSFCPSPLVAPPGAHSRVQPWSSGLGTGLIGSTYNWGANSHLCSWLSPYHWSPQWLFFLPGKQLRLPTLGKTLLPLNIPKNSMGCC